MLQLILLLIFCVIHWTEPDHITAIEHHVPVNSHICCFRLYYKIYIHNFLGPCLDSAVNTMKDMAVSFFNALVQFLGHKNRDSDLKLPDPYRRETRCVHLLMYNLSGIFTGTQAHWKELASIYLVHTHWKIMPWAMCHEQHSCSLFSFLITEELRSHLSLSQKR